MPSAAATVLQSGFTALLGTNGETLTLNRADGTSASLTAIVDRVGPEDDKSPNFTPRDVSTIEHFLNAVTPKPAVGDSYEDENGLIHRIQSVRRRELYLVSICKVSDPA